MGPEDLLLGSRTKYLEHSERKGEPYQKRNGWLGTEERTGERGLCCGTCVRRICRLSPWPFGVGPQHRMAKRAKSEILEADLKNGMFDEDVRVG